MVLLEIGCTYRSQEVRVLRSRWYKLSPSSSLSWLSKSHRSYCTLHHDSNTSTSLSFWWLSQSFSAAARDSWVRQPERGSWGACAELTLCLLRICEALYSTATTDHLTSKAWLHASLAWDLQHFCGLLLPRLFSSAPDLHMYLHGVRRVLGRPQQGWSTAGDGIRLRRSVGRWTSKPPLVAANEWLSPPSSETLRELKLLDHYSQHNGL